MIRAQLLSRAVRFCVACHRRISLAAGVADYERYRCEARTGQPKILPEQFI
jgi:hypothetical protein